MRKLGAASVIAAVMLLAGCSGDSTGGLVEQVRSISIYENQSAEWIVDTGNQYCDYLEDSGGDPSAVIEASKNPREDALFMGYAVQALCPEYAG